MTIPISTVVDVSISIGAQFPSRKGFGILNIVTNETTVIGVAERIRSYNNIDAVVADWGSSSEVSECATAYFSQQPKPTELRVSVRYDDAQAGQVRGGAVDDFSLFENVVDGSFVATIDGDVQNITAMDFTSTTDMYGVATAITTKLQAVATGGYVLATCVYDGVRFYINSGITGNTSAVGFLTGTGSGTDISGSLEMRLGQGTNSQGIDGETIKGSLDAIQNITEDWYGLVFTGEMRDNLQVNGEDGVIDAAEWCEARVKLFMNTSNDVDCLDSVNTNDIMSKLKAKNLRRTCSTFSSHPDEYPSASLAGRAFTVNFSQPDSTITLKFKQFPGISVETLTQNGKAVLNSKLGNALIKVGDSVMFAESFMANGSFFDEVHGVDWLTNAIQINVFGYMLTRTNKVPYTDKGVASLEQQVIKALDEAVNNGLAAPGTSSTGEYLSRGYDTTAIPVALMNDSDKQARYYPGLSFLVLGAGAIHGVQINGIFER